MVEIRQTKDAVPELFQALENCEDGAVISFPEQEYHFYPKRAFRKYYYISNNRHGMKRVAFPIIGKKNVTIDGCGARFVFHGEILPVVIEKSAGITFKNCSIDWQRPFYSEGMITASDKTGVTLEIDRELYPYHFENGEIIFEGEGWERGFSEGVFEIDPATGGPAYRSGDGMGLGIKSNWNVEEVSDGVVRLNEPFPRPGKVGNVLLLRHYRRCCPGIHLKYSKDTLLENVTLHHAGGMGVIGQFCENVTIRKSKVTPSAGRHFSATVDATHFVNCRGKIELADCLFEGQLDDPCNVHGINTRILQIPDSHSAVVELVHYEQHGVKVAFPGDQVQFSDNKTLLAYAENEVESVDRIDMSCSRVTFKKDLSGKLRPGHVMENMSWVPDLHIHGCTCQNNRARGYLISTPGKVVIENNHIESSGAGIKISGDANHWFESGAVRDVLIRNNEFGDCCYGAPAWGRAVIDIDPEISNPWKNPDCFHRNIRIENNKFSTFDVGILFARSVDGITFAGNTIRRTNSYPMISRTKELLTFEACRNIKVGENNVDSSIDHELVACINKSE